MTDAAAEPANDGQPTVEQAALAADAAANGQPAPAPLPAAVSPAADERPELVVGAAFAGGLALALLLKRLAR
jgi:hypothetical protein